jgi:SP family sugar:H+ symporter-like MFS transporter
MGLLNLFSRNKAAQPGVTEKGTPETHTPAFQTPAMSANHSTTSLNSHVQGNASEPVVEESKVTLIALVLGAVSSMGGFMFGYESGQISGGL